MPGARRCPRRSTSRSASGTAPPGRTRRSPRGTWRRVPCGAPGPASCTPPSRTPCDQHPLLHRSRSVAAAQHSQSLSQRCPPAACRSSAWRPCTTWARTPAAASSCAETSSPTSGQAGSARTSPPSSSCPASRTAPGRSAACPSRVGAWAGRPRPAAAAGSSCPPSGRRSCGGSASPTPSFLRILPQAPPQRLPLAFEVPPPSPSPLPPRRHPGRRNPFSGGE
mmetsp:Transcript_155526/g.377801  ORF Transcript_155526/g.377801 Transcript_155526/m.377801 type:complete len:223 (-) Transcript_155526:41-709(-)